MTQPPTRPGGECPFCNYSGPSPVLADEGGAQGHIVIEPLNPVTRGHVLIIPKVHVASAHDSSFRTAEAMGFAVKWARVNGWSDYNLIASVGPHATQTVRHLHVHVVPRRPGDGLQLPWSHPSTPQPNREGDGE